VLLVHDIIRANRMDVNLSSHLSSHVHCVILSLRRKLRLWRFKQDSEAQRALAHTVRLRDIKTEDFGTIFYVGGHGPMRDLTDNPVSIALIQSF
jgi:putative intracellular protease/amidase